MIIDLEKRWPQQPGEPTVISVGFMPGAPRHLQELVIEAAKEWEKCNIRFEWGPPEKSDIRIAITIAFNKSEESSWTVVGTEAKRLSSDTPTMELTWANNENAFRHSILHEFGHVLGAEHEHCSPYFPYHWNRAVIESAFERQLGSREKAIDMLRRNMKRRIPPNQPNVLISRFDEKSIMMYVLHKEWLRWHNDFKKEPRHFLENHDLSALDIRTMKEAYPRQLSFTSSPKVSLAVLGTLLIIIGIKYKA